jgi:hypothetical protein
MRAANPSAERRVENCMAMVCLVEMVMSEAKFVQCY